MTEFEPYEGIFKRKPDFTVSYRIYSKEEGGRYAPVYQGTNALESATDRLQAATERGEVDPNVERWFNRVFGVPKVPRLEIRNEAFIEHEGSGHPVRRNRDRRSSSTSSAT